MENFISKAFKTLEDFEVVIEPVKKIMAEEVEVEEEPTTIREVFEKESSYIATYEFEHNGITYFLFFEGLIDGESCDIHFDSFDINNINEVLVEVLDSEHDFIDNISGNHPEWDSLETPLSEVISVAEAIIEGEEPEPEEKVELPKSEEPEDEPEKNEREFINGNPEENLKVEEPKEESLHESKKLSIEDEDEREEANEMIHKEEVEDEEGVEKVVDKDAEDEDDLKDSYVGNYILKCPVCDTVFYVKPDKVNEVESEEESEETLYTMDGEACPHCGAKDEEFIGCGKVAPLHDAKEIEPAEDLEPAAEEPKEEESKDEESEDDMVEFKPEELEPAVEEEPEEEEKEEVKESLKESMTDYFVVSNGKDPYHSTVYAENGKESAIADAQERPGYWEVVHMVNGNPEVVWKKEPEEHCHGDECKECQEKKFADVKVESLDETKFDSLIRHYLHENYSNVKSYRTVSGSVDDKNNKIVMEGCITFKSGKEKSTKFVFEAKNMNKNGKIKLYGVNETFSKGKAFTLTGDVKDAKLLSESLSYRYKSGDKLIRGKAESLKKR